MSKEGWREIRRVQARERGRLEEDPGATFIRGAIRLLTVAVACLVVVLVVLCWGA